MSEQEKREKRKEQVYRMVEHRIDCGLRGEITALNLTPAEESYLMENELKLAEAIRNGIRKSISEFLRQKPKIAEQAKPAADVVEQPPAAA